MAKIRYGKKHAIRQSKWRTVSREVPISRPNLGRQWGLRGLSTGTSLGESQHQTRRKNDFNLHKPAFKGPSRPVDETEAYDTWKLVGAVAKGYPIPQAIETCELEEVKSLYPNGDSPWSSEALDRIQEHIVENSRLNVTGLLNFRGNLTEGRARSLLNITCSAMEFKADTAAQVVKLTKYAPKIAHLNGIHRPVQSLGMQSFLSRLMQTRTLTKNIKGMADYVAHLFEHSRIRVQLEQLSEEVGDARSWRAKPWRRLIKSEPKEPLREFYPYCAVAPDDPGAELLLTVHNLVPTGINDQVRADFCQELIVKILSGEMSLRELRERQYAEIKRLRSDEYKHSRHLTYVTTDDTLIRAGTTIRNWHDLIAEMNFASSRYTPPPDLPEYDSSGAIKRNWNTWHEEEQKALMENKAAIIDETGAWGYI